MTFNEFTYSYEHPWADPDTNIVYVFLSNRIHPDATNIKLLDMIVRTEIMEVIFNSTNGE